MLTATLLPIMKRMYVKLGGESSEVEAYTTIAPVLKKMFALLGGDISEVESFDTVAPIIDKMVDVVEPGGGGGISLDTVAVFIGDFHETSTQTVSYGAIDIPISYKVEELNIPSQESEVCSGATKAVTTDGAIMIELAKMTGITPAALTLIGKNEALAIA